MYSTREAAERLGLTDAHVRKLLAQGALPGQRVGRTWVVLGLDYQRKRKPKQKRGTNDERPHNQEGQE